MYQRIAKLARNGKRGIPSTRHHLVRFGLRALTNAVRLKTDHSSTGDSTMASTSWIERLLGRAQRRRPQRRTVAPRRSYVPRFDALEHRTLPSTLTVLNLNDSGPGSLRAAIAAANTNPGADMIAFANGLHGAIKLTSGELAITDSVTINGPGENRLTVSGNDSSRVFDIKAGAAVTITDLTIADGQAVQGGGIDNFGNLNVKDCNVLDCQAVGGSGNATTPNAANGGGIANEVGGSLTLTNTLLKNNVAAASAGNDAFGGAVLNLGSTSIADCIFLGDKVTGGGSSSYYDGSYGGGIESFGVGPGPF
jgi:hypothetical protein